jgi:hypothetical protein
MIQKSQTIQMFSMLKCLFGNCKSLFFVAFSLHIQHVDTAPNVRMTVNDEMERIWKKLIVVY